VANKVRRQSNSPEQQRFTPSTVRTAISLLQIQKSSVRTRCILHDLLDLLFTQYTVFRSIVSLDNHNTNGANSQKVSNLKSMRRRRVLAITQQPACSRMTRKSLWSWYDPKVLRMRGDQQLAGSCVRQFVTLELAPDVLSVLSAKINCVRAPTAV